VTGLRPASAATASAESYASRQSPHPASICAALTVPDRGSEVKILPSGCCSRRVLMLASSVFTPSLRQPRRATWQRTLSRSASVMVGSVMPTGAARSLPSNSAADRRPLVAVVSAERGEPLLPEVRCGCGRRVAGEEMQGDRRLDVGKDGFGARPIRVEQSGQLVGRGDAHVDEVVPCPDEGSQRLRLTGVRGGDAQSVRAQPQVLGDHLSVTSVALRPRQDLTVAPLLDRVRLDRDHGVPSLEQRVDETAVGSFDADRNLRRIPESSQSVRAVPGAAPASSKPAIHWFRAARLIGRWAPSAHQFR
jgi:hypothetical protein